MPLAVSKVISIVMPIISSPMSIEISTVRLTMPLSVCTKLSKAILIMPSQMSIMPIAMLTAISMTVPTIPTARAMRDAIKMFFKKKKGRFIIKALGSLSKY